MSTLLIYACKIISKILQFVGRGSSLPGKIALKAKPDILKVAAGGFRVIMVTGTNGKTTTCSMLYRMLQSTGEPVISNESGANMISGIVTCFIDNYKKGGWAVIEADEAYAKQLTEYVKPEYIVVTNIFRDQLDRFGEIYTTWQLVKDAIEKTPESTLVLNADEPIFGKIDLPNPVVYFGFSCGYNDSTVNADAIFCQNCNKRLSFKVQTFQNLGDYYCEECGFCRPKLDFSVDKIRELSIMGSRAVICGKDVTIGVPGIYNVYNALGAYAAATLAGLSHEQIAESLKQQESKFGRHENIDIDGNSLHMMLIKNPTGCDQCIATAVLEDDTVDLMFMLNDNYADGTDVSWIWDSVFEKLLSMNTHRIIIGGTRRFDMAIRLKTAGFNPDKFVICDDYPVVLDAIKASKNKIYALCTYTAMTGLRSRLLKLGYVKKAWK